MQGCRQGKCISVEKLDEPACLWHLVPNLSQGLEWGATKLCENKILAKGGTECANGKQALKTIYFTWIALLITELRKHEVVGNHQCFPLDEAWKKQETEFSCWGAWVLAHVWLGDMCTVRMQFFVCCHLSASSLPPTQRSGRHDIRTVFILTFTASTQLRS